MSNAPWRSPQELRLIAEIRDARFTSGVRCVRCGSPRVCRWGGFSGRQRYRCAACRRTFSDLTGTPAAYLKRLPLLPSYRECLAASLSVRTSARMAGVHPSTSFRWRHRLLAANRLITMGTMCGLVELEEGFVRCTDGGHLMELPIGHRRSRMNPAWVRSWLMVARDRRGRAAIAFSGFSRPGRALWAVMLDTYVDADSIVLTRAPRLSPQGGAARENALPILSCRQKWRGRSPDPLAHLGHASALLDRFRSWLRRFRGVKSIYLDNYIMWHGLIDRARTSERRIEQLLYWPCAPPSSM